MSFGLLTPLFLAGLAAIAIPVIVHLVRREEQRSFAFPSLMFLKAIPIREHRRRTIRHWWLLALRCLIVALLSIAFAKPFIETSSQSIAALSDGRDRVVLLDRSHSMRAGSRWDDALRLARDAVDALDADDRAGLVLFDHDTIVTQTLTTDAASMHAALASARTSDGHTDLMGAIARANALLEESDASKRDIVLISDFQRSAVEPGARPRLAPGIELVVQPVSSEARANAAVADVRIERTPLGEGDAVELSARIVNTSALPIDNAELVMAVDGRDRDRQRVSIAPGSSRDASFRLVLARDEILPVRIHIEDDALTTDNSFHLLVSGPTAIPVLLLKDRRTPPEKTLHLEQALHQGDAPGFRVTSRFVSQLREADIDASDVIIVDDAPIPGGDIGEHLRAYLQSGGGLLVVAAARTHGHWPGGADGIVPGRLGPTLTRTATDPARLLGMNTLHPALAAFAGGDGGDLASAQVFRYRRLDTVDEHDVLARYDDDNVALAERPVGRGHVLALTTTLDPSWNTLALQPGYLPFLHEALKYLASHVPATHAVVVGDTLDLETYARGLPAYTQTAAALARGAVSTLHTPSGQRIPMAPGDAFAPTREAGIHEVHVSGGGSRSLMFAANPLPRESDLSPLDVDAFVASISVDARSEASEAARDARREDTHIGERAWWILLLTCASLLGLDTLFSNRLSRPARAS